MTPTFLLESYDSRALRVRALPTGPSGLGLCQQDLGVRASLSVVDLVCVCYMQHFVAQGAQLNERQWMPWIKNYANKKQA